MAEPLEPRTWRDLLGNIIHKPYVRQQIADALGVSPTTLMRWVNGDSNPRPHNLHRLLEVVPQHRAMLQALIAEEFEEIPAVSPDTSPNEIPVTFYAHILDLSTTTPDELRFWSLCPAILYEARGQLDPDRLGLEISVIQCMAPLPGNPVRCLHERVGLGTPPWREQLESKAELLGGESLAGYAVSSCHLQVIANLSREQRLPTNLPEHVASAAAAPIRNASRIAGCLLAASTQPDYFRSPARCDLIQSYAALLMLAFHPQDFYEQERIALQVMPSFQAQQPYLSTIQQRIMAMLKKAFIDQQPISYSEAEQRVWWQIEEEFLRLQPPPSPQECGES